MLSRFTRSCIAGALGLALAPAIAAAQAPETVDVFPPGPGREEVFFTCTACHGSAIVRQQGLSRDGWDRTIDLMISAKEMPAPDLQTRALILDYLSAAFPPRTRNTNPFLVP